MSGGAFTLIELLVVIAIIAILAAILLPVLSSSQERARKITCVNNNKEIATAILMYVSDNNGAFPVLNEKNLAYHTTNWWWVYLNNGNYMTSSTVTNNIWRCPEVLPVNINPGTYSYYGVIVEGYGPFENTGNELNNLIRYNLTASGTVVGGQNVNVVRRFSQIWMCGDVGVPIVNPPVNELPPSGYYTEITTFQPAVGTTYWLDGDPPKQPACRHAGQAVMSFADGHVESWRWADLDVDKDDIFAENGF